MRQRSRENGLLGDPRPDGETVGGPGSDGLNAALALCAQGDRQGIDELRAWEGGRLRAMLLRMLGEPALADGVLEAALDDVYRNAGMLVAVGQGPSDDRVFALVRRHAYAALRTREHRAGAAPPLPLRPAAPRAAPPPPPAATAPAPPDPAPAAQAPAPAAPAAAAPSGPPPSPLAGDPLDEVRPAAPMALGVATRLPEPPRARRPGLRDEADIDEDDAEADETGRRRWLLAALAWIGAGLVGFAIAVVVAGWLLVEPPPPEPPTAAPAAVLPPPSPPSASPVPASPPPASPAHELLGEPLQSPEPVTLPVSPSRVIPAPTAAPRPASPPPAAARPAAAPTSPAAAPAAPPPRVAAPARPAPAAAAPAPAAAPSVPDGNPGAAPGVPASARLFIHHSTGDARAAERARALAQRLQARGASVVIVRPVPFGIRGLSVRFFHEADRAGATAVLADTVSFAGGPGSAARPTDFTAFQPAPRPGTIEIWLPGGA